MEQGGPETREDIKMLNIIWGLMIAGSVAYMIATGNGAQVAVSITNSAGKAVELCLSLTGIYCFWMGMMNIVQDCGAMRWMAKVMQPVLSKFFPNTSQQAMQAISTNIAANVLGLGNAATPSGLRAMELMAQDSKCQEASDDMIMFLVLNTSSLQIIPTTIISLRSGMGDMAAGRMMIPVLIATSCSTIIGVIACKIFAKCARRKREVTASSFPHR